MQRKTLWKTDNLSFIGALCLYALCVFSFFPVYQYHINEDYICYVSIAQQYMWGNFSDAISGYWSPLFSWLLIPLLSLHLQHAFLIVQVLIGMVAMIGAHQLFLKVEMSFRIRSILLYIVIPSLMVMVFIFLSPDLLVFSIILLYLNILLSADYIHSKFKATMCGLLGGLGYLAKSYALPFFLSHYFVCNVCLYFLAETQEKKKSLFRNLFIGVLACILVSGVWIGILSSKYNHFVISRVGSASLRTEYCNTLFPQRSNASPSVWLSKPVNQRGYSIFDYSQSPIVDACKPLNTVQYALFVLTKIPRELYRLAGIFLFISVFSFAILIACVLFLCSPEKLRAHKYLAMLLIALVLYSTGFVVLHSAEIRYLFPNTFLFLLMGGYVLNELFKSQYLSKPQRNFLIVVFVVSFVAMPIHYLSLFYNADKEAYEESVKLDREFHIKGTFVSESPSAYWYSYYLGSRFYAVETGKFQQVPEKVYADSLLLQNELGENNIDYYFVRQGEGIDFPFLHTYREVTNGKIPRLKVYHLKEKVE